MDIAESLKVLSRSDVRSVLGKTEVKKELDFYRRCFTRVTNTLPLVKELEYTSEVFHLVAN